MSDAEQDRYEEDHQDADYDYRDFYSDVYDALKIKFNARNVTRANKSLKIDSESVSSLSVDVDVVPCSEYRVYTSYPATGDPEYDEGMYFRTRIGNKQIINFPQYHRENGTQKNKNAGKNYKETIRIFKNARDYARQNVLFATGDAPSYYIECLLYNVPNSYFTTSRRSDRFIEILEYLEADNTNLNHFDQQSEMENLFGHTETQWSKPDATSYISDLRSLWDGWPHH